MKPPILFLLSFTLWGCATIEKYTEVTKPTPPLLSNQKKSLCYLSRIATPYKKSEVVIVPKNWSCTWRTVPSGQPLKIWINDRPEPVTFFFGQQAQLFEKVKRLQFGSLTDSVYVRVTLYPPGVLPDLGIVSE